MDEDFEYFIRTMGPAILQRHVPRSTVERFRNKLPNQLLEYWQEHGWCGYANGLFWTVDPQEYEPVVKAWIGGTSLMDKDTYHIIARSAFGKLYFWGERTGDSLKVFAPGSYCFPRKAMYEESELDFGLRIFFGNRDREENDFDDLFTPALKKLGPLAHDEMYGFVPALVLGGSSDLARVQKVKAVEHLVFLAQLESLEIMTPPCL